MTRSKCYVLCFCLALAKIAAPAPLAAQESLGTRFLTEGPKGWKILKTNVRQMEGSFVCQMKLGIHPLIIYETKFKINGELFVYEETRKKEGKIFKVSAHGVNSRYRFALQQTSPPSPWVLAFHGSPSDRMHIQHAYSHAWGNGFIRALDAPFTIAAMPLSEMISETGFKLGKVGEVARDGKKLVKIEFTYMPPDFTPELENGSPIRKHMHMTHMRGGWMLLNPEGNWAIEEYSVDTKKGMKDSGVIEYAKAERGIILPAHIVDKTETPSSWDVTLSDLKTRDIPEHEFTLSAYGLPEPVGVVWPTPTKWWLWLALAAVGMAGLTFMVDKLRRRYQSLQSAKT